MTEPLLTIADVAKIFRVSERTVFNWISSGKIQSVKIGGAIRFRQSDIDRLIQGESAGSTPDNDKTPPDAGSDEPDKGEQVTNQ